MKTYLISKDNGANKYYNVDGDESTFILTATWNRLGLDSNQSKTKVIQCSGLHELQREHDSLVSSKLYGDSHYTKTSEQDFGKLMAVAKTIGSQSRLLDYFWINVSKSGNGYKVERQTSEQLVEAEDPGLLIAVEQKVKGNKETLYLAFTLDRQWKCNSDAYDRLSGKKNWGVTKQLMPSYRLLTESDIHYEFAQKVQQAVLSVAI